MILRSLLIVANPYLTWVCRVADAVDAVEYRVAKTHRMPYLRRSFFAKEPYN